MTAEERQLKRREAARRWKELNYEYWLLQKRILSSREEYKEHRRNVYKLKMDILRGSSDYVPPIAGRPKLYSPREALSRKRASARRWAAAHRAAKKRISPKENYQHDDDTSQTSSKESDRQRHPGGGAAES